MDNPTSSSRASGRGSGAVAGALWAAASGGAAVARAFVGPLAGLARAGIAAGVAGGKATAATPAGRAGLDLALRALNAALEALPGTRPTTLAAEELRESFVAASTRLGALAGLRGVAVAEATMRLVLGDPSLLEREIDSGIGLMRLLADGGDSLDVLPGAPVSAEIRERAQGVVDHTPDRLLAALDGGVPEGSSRAAAIATAVIEDAEDLRHFAAGYSQVVTLLAARIGTLLANDTMSVADLDAFMRGRRFEVWTAAAHDAPRSQRGSAAQGRPSASR